MLNINYINEIKTRLNITSLLSRLNISINGSGFIQSIYKQEKTASLKIYLGTNTYYCFATGKGGDVITFYKDYYKITTKEAVKELASIIGLSSDKYIPERTYKPKYSNNSLNEKKCFLLTSEQELFEEKAALLEYDFNLEKSEAENRAIEFILNLRKEIQINIFESLYHYWNEKGIEEKAYKYLTGKERGLTEKSIKKYKIFSINSVKETFLFLKENFSKDELLVSGLFKKKYFLLTKHRIVIPYIENGKIVYLRGRYFYNNEYKPINTGKYIGLNNWTELLSPKRFFNIDVLKMISPYTNIFITEGEFDCIIANQYHNNSIGISGITNFPRNQIDSLKNYKVILVFDSDEAGQKAIEKISSLFDTPIRTLRLKNHKDISELMNESN